MSSFTKTGNVRLVLDNLGIDKKGPFARVRLKWTDEDGNFKTGRMGGRKMRPGDEITLKAVTGWTRIEEVDFNGEGKDE